MKTNIVDRIIDAALEVLHFLRPVIFVIFVILTITFVGISLLFSLIYVGFGVNLIPFPSIMALFFALLTWGWFFSMITFFIAETN